MGLIGLAIARNITMFTNYIILKFKIDKMTHKENFE